MCTAMNGPHQLVLTDPDAGLFEQLAHRGPSQGLSGLHPSTNGEPIWRARSDRVMAEEEQDSTTSVNRQDSGGSTRYGCHGNQSGVSAAAGHKK